MNFIAIDFETANASRDSACALGVAVVANGSIKDSFACLIRPPILDFSPINVAIHGITADDVADKPEFDEVWKRVAPLLVGSPLVAHNASFDFSVLRTALHRYSIDCPTIQYHCTCLLARHVWSHLPNHRLPTVAEHLGVCLNHHDAASDATACALIAIAACKSLDADSLAAAATTVGLQAQQLSDRRVPRSSTAKRSAVPVPALPQTKNPEGSSMTQVGEVSCTYTSRGLARYSVTISHEGLLRFQEIRSDNGYVLIQKAQAKAAQWDEMWEREQEAARRRIEKLHQTAQIEEGLALADERTKRAQAELMRLEKILAETFDVDDTIDWDSLKSDGDYPKARPPKPILPTQPKKPEAPPKPESTDPKYKVQFGILDRLIESRRQRIIGAQAKRFAEDCRAWSVGKEAAIEAYNQKVREYNASLCRLQEQFADAIKTWEKKRAAYLETQARANAAIEKKKEAYSSGAPGAIVDYCDMVLTRSSYPDCFPQTFELEYRPDSMLLVVDYQLPALKDLPTVKEVTYSRSRNEFAVKNISESQLSRLYDSVLYQIALRTIHELFEADQIDALESVVFNGFVTSNHPATGRPTTGCILSVQANRDEFAEINLANVDYKACFRKLKGVGSSKLHSMAPVAPIVALDKEDRRFVEAVDIATTLDDSTNLAAMDWEEFEHLIRQLFERHFAAGGGEVRVTHASRDGGVDAVAFDPDPIRGGKIVIQAKRYTNTVGVGAVRDLYGTLMNEGANKGILVTTSHYGPDAYGFAKGKPITLLDGSNLLHLLQSYGYKAKIDINEARRQMAS